MEHKKIVEHLEKIKDDYQKDFHLAQNVQERMYAKGAIDAVLEILEWIKKN
jgi:hypothetical protein